MHKLVHIRRRKFMIKGSKVNYYEVVEPDIVTIIPILDDGRIVIEKQYRPVIGKYIYEVPAGHVSSGEAPMRAAARELEEETGYRAKSLKLVLRTYHSVGSSRTVNNYFIAKGLYQGNPHPDAHEIIRVKKMSLSEAMEKLDGKGIHDTKTTMALLLLTQKRLI